MLGTIALTALNLLDDIKPKPESRVEKYITDRVPMLSIVRDEDDTDVFPAIPKVVKPRKQAKPRRKHVCTWTDRDVWGACVFSFILGGFLAYVIF